MHVSFLLGMLLKLQPRADDNSQTTSDRFLCLRYFQCGGAYSITAVLRTSVPYITQMVSVRYLLKRLVY